MSRIRADKFVNNAATGAPQLTLGAEIPVGYGLTGAGGINVGGAVTAASGNFTGAVTVGGVLTYEDVTSVDSVGIVTARGGVELGAAGVGGTFSAAGFGSLEGGLNVAGVVTATSYSGSGANLTGIDAAPSFTGIASGSLTNGQTVAITDDGKVTGITSTVTAALSFGKRAIFNKGVRNHSAEEPNIAYDSQSKKIICGWSEGGNADWIHANVGEVNGSNIVFGQEVILYEGDYATPVYDVNANKTVLGFRASGDSGDGKCRVGTITGLGVTFGPLATFSSGNIYYMNGAYDATNNKVIFSYTDYGSSQYPYAVVGTVSGDTISFGSQVAVVNSTCSDDRGQPIVYDPDTGKIVVVYVDAGDSNKLKSKVGTVSGTSISFGTLAQISANNCDNPDITYDTVNNKVVVVYRDTGNSNYGTAAVGTVSGTDISFGTPVVFNSGNSTDITARFDENAGKVVISYRDEGNQNKGTFIYGTVSGTSISFGTESVFRDQNVTDNRLVYVSQAKRSVVVVRDRQENNLGGAFTLSPNTIGTNLTSSNFLGISNAAYSNGDSAKIQLVGSIDDAQTGLTTGAKYFVQSDGSLDTIADNPSVDAGIALSDTEILIR